MSANQGYRASRRQLLRWALSAGAATGTLAAGYGGRPSPDAERATVTTQPMATSAHANAPPRLRQQLGVAKYLISQKTKAPEASFRLVQALVGEEAGIRLGIDGTWGMPVRKAHERANALADPRRRVCVESVRYATPRQVVPQHLDVQPAMGRHVETAIRGATPVKEALKAMDATVTMILRGD